MQPNEPLPSFDFAINYRRCDENDCRIDGPLLTDGGVYRPASGLVETPGLTTRLSSEQAHYLDARIKTAIEKIIRASVEEYEHGAGLLPVTPATNRGRRKATRQDKGAEDA
jgi:hypothetical protein